MVEISTLKEGSQDQTIKSALKIKNRMPMCRLITPNETILFGNKKLKNIGKEPTITCELTTEFSEQKVLEKIQSEPWYPDYTKMRENIIERCKVEGKLPIKQCESRDHISEHLLIGTDTDAFDTLNATHFRTRYIANLVDKIYPKTKDKDGNYTQRFHARNMHYRLLSENIGVPTFVKGEGWQISKYIGSQKQWDNLKEGLTEARNAGLIPFNLMRDARVLFEVKPSDFVVGKAREDFFQPNVNLDLQMNKNFDLDIEVPQIIFYSEKSEMGYVLDKLSQKYANVGYFLGRGQISTSNASELYDFIKQHGDNALILTLNDWDSAGFNISQSLARKLQARIQADKSEGKPKVSVIPFAIGQDDKEKFEEIGKGLSVKIYKKQGAKEIIELSALDLLAHEQGISLTEWFDQELQKIIKFDPDCLECSTLISNEQINQKREQEENKLKAEIEKSLNSNLETHPMTQDINKKLRLTPKSDGSYDLDDYLENLNTLITQLPSYKVLKSSVEQTTFIPEDVINESMEFIDENKTREQSLLWKDENNSYQKATERLLNYKLNTKDIIKMASVEQEKRHIEMRKMDLNIAHMESDDELAEAILSTLDNLDKQDSQHTILAVLNNDPNKPRRLYASPKGQFGKVMKRLTKEGKITYLPVKVGVRERGYYKGKIEVQKFTPLIERPIFKNRLERTNWELEQYKTKEKAKKALISEAIRLFQSKNPATGKFWRLEEIAQALGYSVSPVFTWLKKAGVDTKSVRLNKI